MKHLIYILLFTLTTQSQNLTIGCVETIYEKQFIKVNDTLKVYNSQIMLQSGSGFKINKINGNVRFIHGRLALEEGNDFVKPVLLINDCLDGSVIIVSNRINLYFNEKKCYNKIKIFNQL